MSIESQSHLTFDACKVFCWKPPYSQLASTKADRYYLALLNISPNMENMVFTPESFRAFAKIIMETQYKSFSVVEIVIDSPQLIQVQFIVNNLVRHLERSWQLRNGTRIVEDYNCEEFQQNVLEPLKISLEECAASFN